MTTCFPFFPLSSFFGTKWENVFIWRIKITNKKCWTTWFWVSYVKYVFLYIFNIFFKWQKVLRCLFTLLLLFFERANHCAEGKNKSNVDCKTIQDIWQTAFSLRHHRWEDSMNYNYLLRPTCAHLVKKII